MLAKLNRKWGGAGGPRDLGERVRGRNCEGIFDGEYLVEILVDDWTLPAEAAGYGADAVGSEGRSWGFRAQWDPEKQKWIVEEGTGNRADKVYAPLSKALPDNLFHRKKAPKLINMAIVDRTMILK